MTDDNARAALALADRFWDEVLAIDPIAATYVGDERFDDRLGIPGQERLAARETLARWALDELGRIDRESLDEDLRPTLDIVEMGARRELDSVRFRFDRFEAVTHMFGPAGLLATLGSLTRADTPERLDRYVARLSAYPAFVDGLVEVMDGAVRDGQVMPGLVIDRTVGQVERMLATAPEDSPGVAPIPEADGDGRERVAATLRASVWPSYERYLEALRRYRGSARDTIGLSALPDGEAMYAACIWGYTSLEMKAEEIHRTGVETLAGIERERREIARTLGHETAEEALAAYDASGKDRASSREELLRMVQDQVDRSWEAAPRFFGRLPRANCDVRPVEEFREDDMPGAYYNGPTGDGTRPGIYYVNTGQLDGRPLHQTATTSFHEANPGHHFQISLEMEYEHRPRLRRFGGYLVGDAFPEGWGLYSERLADEMGLFLNEYERLGMLEAQAFRAGRLIVDTGLHALGWDRERAVAQMVETGATRTDSEIEVDRYIADPGQALAYMLGSLEIQRWRREAAEREGDGFSTKDFHDRLLALGSLPLATIERELLRGS